MTESAQHVHGTIMVVAPSVKALREQNDDHH
jgi:hypothetical protein